MHKSIQQRKTIAFHSSHLNENMVHEMGHKVNKSATLFHSIPELNSRPAEQIKLLAACKKRAQRIDNFTKSKNLDPNHRPPATLSHTTRSLRKKMVYCRSYSKKKKGPKTFIISCKNQFNKAKQ